MSIKCGHCHGKHDTVPQVRACAAGDRGALTPAGEAFLGISNRPQVSPGKMNFAHTLLRERTPYGAVLDAETSNSLEAAHELVNGFDRDEVDDFIDNMKRQPRRGSQDRTVRVLIEKDGMYETPDGVIYKVQRAVHGSGHLYAKRLHVRRLDDGEAEVWFEMEPGAVTTLRPEWKMTTTQAVKFGRLYGVCVRCGRTLTNEISIELGIGPICAGKEGW